MNKKLETLLKNVKQKTTTYLVSLPGNYVNMVAIGDGYLAIGMTKHDKPTETAVNKLLKPYGIKYKIEVVGAITPL